MSTSTKHGYHHGNLREALLTAAMELLNEAGAAEMSLRAVARRAGVSATAPYRHFADKQALLAAIAEHGFVNLRRALLVANAPAPAERLIGQGVAYVGFAVAHPALFRLMFGSAPGDYTDHTGLQAAGAAAFETLQASVVALFPHAPTEQHGSVALACWSLVHGLAALQIESRLGRFGNQPEALAGATTSLVVQALDAAINSASFRP